MQANIAQKYLKRSENSQDFHEQFQVAPLCTDTVRTPRGPLELFDQVPVPDQLDARETARILRSAIRPAVPALRSFPFYVIKLLLSKNYARPFSLSSPVFSTNVFALLVCVFFFLTIFGALHGVDRARLPSKQHGGTTFIQN